MSPNKEQAIKELARRELYKRQSSKSTNLMDDIVNGIGSYLKDAQPAFKSFVSHPYEYLSGTAGQMAPSEFEDKPWSDVYRESGGGVLPFAKSTTTAGQLVPQLVGEILDTATRPSGWFAPKLLDTGLIKAAENLATRQVLEKYTPVLAKDLLEKTPVKAVQVGTRKAEKYISNAGGDMEEAIPQFLADNVNWKHWGKKIGVPEADTDVVYKYGADEVEKAGNYTKTIQTPQGPQVLNVPMIVEDSYKTGIRNYRPQLSKVFDKVKYLNKEKVGSEDVSSLVSQIRKIEEKIGNPDSPIIKNIEEKIASIKGIRPQAVKQMQGHLGMEEIESLLERSGFDNKITLDSLHSLKQSAWDNVSPKGWKSPRSVGIEEQVSKEVGDLISNFIEERNPMYRMANNQWRQLKNVENNIYDVSGKLSKNWNKMSDTKERQTLENSIDTIEKYFKDRGLAQYTGKEMLKKYHAYQSWAGEEGGKLGSFREGRVADMAGQALGGIAGGLTGGVLGAGGLPMAGGAIIGSRMGRAAATELMRPSFYWKILKRIKPGSLSKGITEPTQIAHPAEILKSFIEGVG